MKKFLVVEGFGDFDTPENCWDVRVVKSFDDEAKALASSEKIWENYAGGNDWKSFFVLVRELHEVEELLTVSK
jgi:hypothetical protein